MALLDPRGSLFEALYGRHLDEPGAGTGVIPDAGPDGSPVAPIDLPAPPVYSVPDLLASPDPGFGGRLALGLSRIPAYQHRPFEGGASSAVRGALSGLAAGYSGPKLLSMQRDQQRVDTQNKANQMQADRNYAAAVDTWKSRLKIATDAAGNWLIDKATAEKYPSLAPFVGRSAPPGEVMSAIGREQAAKAASDRADQTFTETVRHNRETESATRQRLALDARKAATAGGSGAADDSWMDYLVQHTADGTPYLDMTNVGAKDQKAAIMYAGRNGIKALNKNQVAKMHSIEDAEANISDMLAQAETFLSKSKDPASRFLAAGRNTVAGATQMNPTISSWNTWRISAIQQLVALAGGQGSGLRINQAEIKQATENDIPKITDSYAVAQQKANNILGLLANARKAQLGMETGVLTTRVGQDGKRHIVLSSQAAPAGSGDGRVRVVGPNGQSGTVPKGTALPEGWRFQ